MILKELKDEIDLLIEDDESHGNRILVVSAEHGWSTPLDSMVLGVYEAETTWSGEFTPQSYIGDTDTDCQIGPEAVPAILLCGVC